MINRVYYYPTTDEIVVAELDQAMGWFIVDWGDGQKDIYEPSYFTRFGFEYLGEL